MATKRWQGSAAPTYDLWTVALSGTVTSQTYTFTCNSKTVTYTSGGADTVTIILAALATAWNASVNPEMMELTAAALPAAGPYTSMTITGDTLGKPSTISAGTSGAATFTATHTTTASGPNDFTNVQNWSGGVAPANSDTLIFDSGSVSCLYNISTALTGITLKVEPQYSGNIGLPFLNNDGATAYTEYRTTSLTFAGGTAIINGALLKRCNLAFGANTSTIRVLSTGQRIDQYTPVVLITGGNGSSELDITKGDVGLAFYAGTTATMPVISMSYLNAPASDSRLTVGTGATLTTINKNGGNAIVNSTATTITQGIAGGTLTVGEAAAVTTLNAQGGTVVYNSTGTLATLNVSNKAIVDFNQDPRAKTITNTIQAYGDAYAVKDDLKLVNSGVVTIKVNNGTMLNVSHGSNNTVTLT